MPVNGSPAPMRHCSPEQFELESDFSPTKVRWEAFGLEKQAPRSLEVTLNDVTLALATRDADQRTNNAERTPEIEVILEISEEVSCGLPVMR